LCEICVSLVETHASQVVDERTELTAEETIELPEGGKFSFIFKLSRYVHISKSHYLA